MNWNFGLWTQEELDKFADFWRLSVVLDQKDARQLRTKEYEKVENEFTKRNFSNTWKNLATGFFTTIAVNFAIKQSRVRFLNILNTLKFASLGAGIGIMFPLGYYRAASITREMGPKIDAMLSHPVYKKMMMSERDAIDRV